MMFSRDTKQFSAYEVRAALPHISLPETLLPEHVAEFGFIEYVEPAVEPTLDERRETRCAEINALADAKLAAFAYDFGAPDGVLTLQLRDSEDRLSWLTLRGTATSLLAQGLSSAPLPIRTAENVTIVRTASEASAMLDAMAHYAGMVKLNSWMLKDAARASESPEAVDITAGWPA